MEFRGVETVHGDFVPIFDGDGPEAWLRASFLNDTWGCTDEMLALIARARQSGPDDPPPPEWGGNEMWVSFSPDRAVITHQWIFGPDGREEEIAIPLDDAESLLRAWQREVEAWQERRGGRN